MNSLDRDVKKYKVINPDKPHHGRIGTEIMRHTKEATGRDEDEIFLGFGDGAGCRYMASDVERIHDVMATTYDDVERLKLIANRLAMAAEFTNTLIQLMDDPLGGPPKPTVNPTDWIILSAMIDIPKRLLPGSHQGDHVVEYIQAIENRFAAMAVAAVTPHPPTHPAEGSRHESA